MLTHYSDFAVDNIVQQQCYARIRAGMWGSLGGGGIPDTSGCGQGENVYISLVRLPVAQGQYMCFSCGKKLLIFSWIAMQNH